MIKKKFLCSILAISLAASCMMGCGSADPQSAATDNTVKNEDEKTEELTKEVTDGMKGSSVKEGKDETVYVIMNNDGSVSNITVSDVLKNHESGNLSDVSELKDIKNLKGDEAYQADGKNLTWNAGGKDISYQGTSDKELPVDISISYRLDGKKVTAEELAGASGHLEMTYTYKNKTKKDDLIVPFVCASGMMLAQDKASNVTIDNGKVVEEGNNSIIVGYAIPGLKDCITSQIDGSEELFDKIGLSDSFTVEADVTDFESEMSLSVVLPDVIGSEKIEDIDYSEITEKIDELNDAATQLVDGTRDLDDGALKLKDGGSDLKAGARKLDKGARDLKLGAFKVNNGTKTLSEGAVTLKNGA